MDNHHFLFPSVPELFPRIPSNPTPPVPKLFRPRGDTPPDSDSLRAHLHVLRNAIDKPFDKPLIHTLRGIGWQITDTETDASTS